MLMDRNLLDKKSAPDGDAPHPPGMVKLIPVAPGSSVNEN